MRRLFATALLAASVLCTPTARAADETGLDPSKVSDSLKAKLDQKCREGHPINGSFVMYCSGNWATFPCQVQCGDGVLTPR